MYRCSVGRLSLQEPAADGANAEQLVTPWDVQGEVVDGVQVGINYDKLMNQFGCQALTPELIARFERVTGEPAHLESFVRFVEVNGLVDELRAVRAGVPDSAIPFVSKYNGPGFREFNYHVKLTDAAK